MLPRLPASAVETMKEMSYQQRVVYIMNSFLEGFAASELTTYASEAYGGGKFSHEHPEVSISRTQVIHLSLTTLIKLL